MAPFRTVLLVAVMALVAAACGTAPPDELSSPASDAAGTEALEQPPDPPSVAAGHRVDAAPWSLDALSPDEQVLRVSSGFGGCESAVRTDATESAEAVTVTVWRSTDTEAEACADMLTGRSDTVVLSAPLGDRRLEGCQAADCRALGGIMPGEAPTPHQGWAAGASDEVVLSDDGVVVLDADTGAERWQRDLATPAGRGAAAVTDSTVVVAEGPETARAFDRSTGAPLWTLPIWEAWSGAGSAVAAGDELVAVFTSQTEVAGVDAADGNVRWRVALPGTGMALRSADGLVAAAAAGGVDGAGGPGAVVAVDADTGTERWRTPIDATPRDVFVAAGVVLVVFEGRLRAFDLATGEVRWERDRTVGESGLTVVGDRFVLTAHAEGPGGALDPATGGELTWAEPAPVGWTSAVAGDLLVWAETDTVVAADADTGAERWRVELSAPVGVPAVVGDHVVVGSALGAVALRRDDGTLAWSWLDVPEDAITAVPVD